MLDIGWSEFLIVSIVALVVIGPRDLPKAMYTVGKWVRTARKVAGEFQRHVDDMVRDTELDEVRKGLQSAKNFNPKHQLEKFVDPKGQLKHAFDPTGGDKSAAPKKAPVASDEAAAETGSGDDAEPANSIGQAAPSLRESQPDPVKVKPVSATVSEDKAVAAAEPKPPTRKAKTSAAGKTADKTTQTKAFPAKKAPSTRKKSTTAKAAESAQTPAKRRSGAASAGKKTAAGTKAAKSPGPTPTAAKKTPTRRRKPAEPAAPSAADSNE